MGRLQQELRLVAQNDRESLETLKQKMKLFEKLGDIAAKLECYQVALNNYIAMVIWPSCFNSMHTENQ